jgi:site-specific recombinase XerD
MNAIKLFGKETPDLDLIRNLGIKDLIEMLSKHMHELGYSPAVLSRYTVIFRKLHEYFSANNIEKFSVEAGRQFIWEECGTLLDDDYYSGHVKRAVYVLSDFQRYGMIFKQSAETLKEFTPELKPLFENFLVVVRKSGIVESSVKRYRSHMFRFEYFLNNRGIFHFNQVELHHINTYVESLAGFSQNHVSTVIRNLKWLMDYAYENGYHSKTFSETLPTIRYKQSSRLPATFSAEETDRIIEHIDRNNPFGKRNYAIILTVAKLGLRIGDVLKLRFDSLNWGSKTISITQSKTGVPLELPLLEDVGWAIIDYLKHGRPKTDCKNIFVCHRPPFDELLQFHATKMMTRLVQKAGIKMPANKTIGMHTFRHSIATIMLSNGEKLTDIAQTLGHLLPEDTEKYISLDVNMLRQCALEVVF